MAFTKALANFEQRAEGKWANDPRQELISTGSSQGPKGPMLDPQAIDSGMQADIHRYICIYRHTYSYKSIYKYVYIYIYMRYIIYMYIWQRPINWPAPTRRPKKFMMQI